LTTDFWHAIGDLAQANLTGVSSVDTFVAGPPYGTVDNFTLYKLDPPMDMVSEATATWQELCATLEDRQPDRRTTWIVALYTPMGNTTVAHTDIFTTLLNRLDSIDAAFVCTSLNGTDRAIMLKKRDLKGLPDFTIVGMTHSLWTFPKGHAKNHKRIVELFARCCTHTRTNLNVVPAEEGLHSFEQILAATENLNEADLRALRGTIMVKPATARSSSDLAMLRCMPLILEVRKDREPLGDSTVFWRVLNAPTSIAPRRFFMNLHQTGLRLVEQTDGAENMEYTLEYILSNIDVLRQHGIVIMGADRTTGHGKSSIARHLAAAYATHMCGVLHRPRSEATVVSSTTLEDLSGLAMKTGWSVFLDDIDMSDVAAVQYMSTGILKCLVDPQNTSSLRARAKNVRIPADCARIFTTNARSLSEWAGDRFVVTPPIRRKLICFVITEPLIDPAWASRVDYRGAEL
jgi:hypothetical protein